MKSKFVSFFKQIFPFLVVIILWRLSHHFWNPGGILAIIPIFFCSFVKKVPWFTLCAVIFCFLLDYNFNTKLFWTTVYCLLYAVDSFQSYIDLSSAQKNALGPFLVFFGITLFCLSIIYLNWTVLLRMLWMFFWCGILYFPVTESIKRVSND